MAAYTHGHHDSVLRSHRWRTAQNSAAYLLPHLRATDRLLDVGAGPGTITADLAELVSEVVATEIGEAELQLSRTTAAGRGVSNIDFRVADVHALDFPDDSFDVTHAHQVLQHVADPVQALRELARVTKPGGIIAVRDSDYGGFRWWPAVPALDDWLDLYYRAAHANGGEPDAGRRLLAWAHAAGLTDVVATSSTWCYATADDRAWWGGMWADRILSSAIAPQLLESGAATREDLQRISDGWREWAASDDGWISLLHGEILCRGGLSGPGRSSAGKRENAARDGIRAAKKHLLPVGRRRRRGRTSFSGASQPRKASPGGSGFSPRRSAPGQSLAVAAEERSSSCVAAQDASSRRRSAEGDPGSAV